MYFTADKRLFKKDFDKVDAFVRVVLIGMGLLVGLGLGLYVAAKTMPLPDTSNNYFYRTP